MKRKIATMALALAAISTLFGGYSYWQAECEEVYNNPTEATEEFIHGAWYSSNPTQEGQQASMKDQTRVFGCVNEELSEWQVE